MTEHMFKSPKQFSGIFYNNNCLHKKSSVVEKRKVGTLFTWLLRHPVYFKCHSCKPVDFIKLLIW